MRITKVKHNPKSGSTTIAWVDERGDTDVIEASLSSVEAPRPELIAALAAFTDHVLRVCELPDTWRADLTITGVALSHNDHQGTGLVVTAQKAVAGAKSPVILNTPHIPEQDDHGACLGAGALAAIDTLVEEALLFRSGKRAQQELPLGSAA